MMDAHARGTAGTLHATHPHALPEAMMAASSMSARKMEGLALAPA